jgi:hypothetical protein
LSIAWYSKEYNVSETISVSIHRWKGGRRLSDWMSLVLIEVSSL